MKENLKEGVYDEASGKYFTNDFRIGYFDNKILCIKDTLDSSKRINSEDFFLR